MAAGLVAPGSKAAPRMPNRLRARVEAGVGLLRRSPDGAVRRSVTGQIRS